MTNKIGGSNVPAYIPAIQTVPPAVTTPSADPRTGLLSSLVPGQGFEAGSLAARATTLFASSLVSAGAMRLPTSHTLAPALTAPGPGATPIIPGVPTTPTTPATPTTPPPPPRKDVGTRRQRMSAELLLRRAGFAPGKVDGQISARARKAIAAFQKSVGIDDSGYLDKSTYRKLKNVGQRIKKYKGKVLGPGQMGKRVKDMQRRLHSLGYSVGKFDGVYDANVANAVKEFKRDQSNIRSRSGAMSEGARRVLQVEARRLAHDPQRIRVKPSRTRQLSDTRAAKATSRQHRDGTEGIGLNSKGPTIKYVQQHLRAAGYDPKSTKGLFDERTAGMVKQFQRRSGLPVTGRVDAKTWSKLQKATLEAKTGTSPAQREGERSNAVKKSEQLLKKLGFNPGSRDGLYTKQTQKAVDAFRKKHHIKGRGQGITTHTLSAMKRVYKKLNSGVSLRQLQQIMPNLPTSTAKVMLPHLNKAMAEAKINTPLRRAAFLAQLAHESVELRYMEEIASGAAYEGRTDLGNTQPGDGVRFKGRGPIQLTGRSNYAAAGKALGLNLIKNPKSVATPKVGFRTTAWYWNSRGLNRYADTGNFDAITRGINGGYNGKADRDRYYARALQVLKR